MREDISWFCRSKRGIGGTPLLFYNTLLGRRGDAHFKSDSSGCTFIRHFSLGCCSQKSHRGVSPPPSRALAPRWAGLGSFMDPQAHRKVGLAKMTVSLSMSDHISRLTFPAQQHLPSLPKQSSECINETKNLERARGNHGDVFTARRVSQVNSHSQNGQQKDSLQLPRVPA